MIYYLLRQGFMIRVVCIREGLVEPCRVWLSYPFMKSIRKRLMNCVMYVLYDVFVCAACLGRVNEGRGGATATHIQVHT